jgi:hypothetical protein
MKKILLNGTLVTVVLFSVLSAGTGHQSISVAADSEPSVPGPKTIKIG